jgi:hypothetical protein
MILNIDKKLYNLSNFLELELKQDTIYLSSFVNIYGQEAKYSLKFESNEIAEIVFEKIITAFVEERKFLSISYAEVK